MKRVTIVSAAVAIILLSTGLLLLMSSANSGVRSEAKEGRGLAHLLALNDTIPPVTTVGLTGERGSDVWFRSAITVTFTSTDEGSGVNWTKYRIDKGDWLIYGGPFVVADGQHTIRYFSADIAGNMEDPHSIVVGIDTTRPTITIVSPTGNVSQSPVTISWSAIDLQSGISYCRIFVAYRDSNLTPEGGLSVPNLDSIEMNLTDGDYTILVTAADGAGNVANQTLEFTVNTNLLSFGGPMGAWPDVGLLILAIAVVSILIDRIRKSRKLA